eukprot:TRINITY_DN4318_c0_g1_i1.p1 TRINITY_DN4318_c0_g1~~TRINITY_DN4318_c0_g1_i1.p1  ORF type:complete len:301 (-),score=79.27 TRINITY_DN4318_c0_g1_i1:82-933(-)
MDSNESANVNAQQQQRTHKGKEKEKDNASEDEDEGLFDPEMFIDKHYVEKVFTFEKGDVKRKLTVLTLLSSSTDYDLTGQIIWPASAVLCKYIESNPLLFENANTLEVGSGVGICGLLSSTFCNKTTVLSDNVDIVVENLEKNVVLNKDNGCKNVYAEKLDWGNLDHIKNIKDKYGAFDLIIGSDVVFWQSAIRPLLQTVTSLLNETHTSHNTLTPTPNLCTPTFILCYQSRAQITDDYLENCSNEFGLCFEHISLHTFLEPEEIEKYKFVKLMFFKRNISKS